MQALFFWRTLGTTPLNCVNGTWWGRSPSVVSIPSEQFYSEGNIHCKYRIMWIYQTVRLFVYRTPTILSLPSSRFIFNHKTLPCSTFAVLSIKLFRSPLDHLKSPYDFPYLAYISHVTKENVCVMLPDQRQRNILRYTDSYNKSVANSAFFYESGPFNCEFGFLSTILGLLSANLDFYLRF